MMIPEEKLEEVLDLLNSTALMLRGMTLDPAIPVHAKSAMLVKIHRLEEMNESLQF